ncbi:hypothetical protein BC833DRAFT_569496 [Globomyces pollinis-pini]|nr:hypothetical protein BC833DRAFT_569496 [Globomyces pollinis-pini]
MMKWEDSSAYRFKTYSSSKLGNKANFILAIGLTVKEYTVMFIWINLFIGLLAHARLIPSGVPDSFLSFHQTLYSNQNYNYSLSWSIVDGQLDAILSLNTVDPLTAPLTDAWIGIGFGTRMFDSQFIVCHNQNNGSVDMHEHISQGTYAPPLHFMLSNGSESFIMTNTLGIGSGTQLICSFSRLLDFPDSVHVKLDPSKPSNMIWAFNPNSQLNYRNELFTRHTPTGRGGLAVILSTGSIIPQDVSVFETRKNHGIGMIIVWLFILPFGSLFARYFRSVYGWLLIKITIQVTGIMFFIGFIILVSATNVKFGSIHTILGVIISIVIGFQVILGILSVLGLSQETLEVYRRGIKLAHRVLGFGLLLIAMVQIGLGINMLFPLVEPRDKTLWVIYFTGILFWIVIFIGYEVYWYTNVKRDDEGYSKVISETIDRTLSIHREPSLNVSYTWDTLDKAVMSGKMLVVANGRYVYDISKWIGSHPGGQIILQTVCGTDISNDYFHNAGFDAEEFIFHEVPVKPKRNTSSIIRTDLSHTQLQQVKRSSLQSRNSLISLDKVPMFTAQDWTFIQRSRRTHVHTKLAIEKLSSMFVGRLVNYDDVMYDDSTNHSDTSFIERGFNPSEYRRYTITQKEMEPITLGSRLVIRLRFCLLYPYDLRKNQPIGFQPGQCLEIQARIGSERISRYYTPINGDLNSFEIIVQVEKHGKMSEFLNTQECGGKQFKVRGPFGTPLLTSSTLYGYGLDEIPDTIYFFAGGSGMTPCLQLTNYLYFSTRVNIQVVQAYQAMLPDEVSLEVGDIVQVYHHYMDGWGFGINLRTMREGSFPIGCTLPRQPIRLFLIHISNDTKSKAIGLDIMEASNLSFPQLCQTISIPSNDMNLSTMNEILDDHVKIPQIVICCNPIMNSLIVDLVVEKGSKWNDRLRILAGDTWS